MELDGSKKVTSDMGATPCKMLRKWNLLISENWGTRILTQSGGKYNIFINGGEDSHYHNKSTHGI